MCYARLHAVIAGAWLVTVHAFALRPCALTGRARTEDTWWGFSLK